MSSGNKHGEGMRRSTRKGQSLAKSKQQDKASKKVESRKKSTEAVVEPAKEVEAVPRLEEQQEAGINVKEVKIDGLSKGVVAQSTNSNENNNHVAEATKTVNARSGEADERYSFPKVSKMSKRFKKLADDADVMQFTGHIEFVEDAMHLRIVVGVLSQERLLGFDVERRPNWVAGQPRALPAILQLSTRSHAYIFRLGAFQEHQSAAPLLELLENESILKVGVGVDDDVSGLCERFLSLQPAGFLRLEELAQRAGVPEVGLAKLVNSLFSKELDKPKKIVLSNWEKRVLTPKQLLYAATDAWVGGEIAHSLLQRLGHDLHQIGSSENVPRSKKIKKPPTCQSGEFGLSGAGDPSHRSSSTQFAVALDRGMQSASPKNTNDVATSQPQTSASSTSQN